MKGKKCKPLGHSINIDSYMNYNFYRRFERTPVGEHIRRITSCPGFIEKMIAASDYGLPAAQVFQDAFAEKEFLELLERSGYSIDIAKQFLGRRILGILEQLDFEKVGKAPTKNDGPIRNGMVYQRSSV